MTPDEMLAFSWPRIRLMAAFTAAKLLYIGVGCFVELGHRAIIGPWW